MLQNKQLKDFASVSASHTGRYARLTSLGLYVMYTQAVQSVRPVESTASNTEMRDSDSLGPESGFDLDTTISASVRPGPDRAVYKCKEANQSGAKSSIWTDHRGNRVLEELVGSWANCTATACLGGR